MIARKSFLIVISTFFIDFLGIAGAFILAKLWGEASVAALGAIGFALSSISIFNIFSSLGLGHAHVKKVSEGKDLGTCLGTYITIKLFVTGLMLLFIFITIFVLSKVFNQSFTDATTESVFLIIIIWAIFNSLKAIPVDTFTGRREIAKRQIALMFENLTKLPLLIIVALAGATGLVASGTIFQVRTPIEWPGFLQGLQKFIATHALGSLAMTYAFGMMGTFVVGLYLLRKYPIKKPNLVMFKSYFLFALPLAFSSIASIIAHNVDKVMIGFFWTSTEVGYYFVVERITGFIAVFSLAVSTVLFPTISSYHSKKSFTKIKKTVHLAERYISMILIPPVIFIFLFSRPIVEIMLDTAYLPGASVLVILSVWVFIRSVSLPYSNLLVGINLPKIQAMLGVSMCLVNIFLNYLIIPKDGILSNILIGNYIISINGPNGAAVSTVIAGLIVYFGTRFEAKKHTGIKILQIYYLKHFIAGIVMGGVLYYLNSFIIQFRWFHLILFAGLGLIIYLAILYILKEFKKQDFMFFWDIINPKKMASYVKTEMKEKSHIKK
jgi:O-antigen/teichoic acid export membrane protein